MISKTATMKASELATFLPGESMTLPSAFDLGIEAYWCVNVIPLKVERQISLTSDLPAQIEITTPHASPPVPIKHFGGRNLPQLCTSDDEMDNQTRALGLPRKSQIKDT